MKIKTKRMIACALFLSMMVSSAGMLQNSYKANASTPSTMPLQGKIVTVPTGSVIPATAMMEISSETLTLGQNVSVAISNNYYYNNTLVAPIGSSINGTVLQVKKAGRAGKNGEILVKFTNIITPYGQMIPISGRIQTEDNTGVIKCGTAIDTTKDYAKDIAIGTAAGAIAGTIMAPLSGGKVGKGAAYGTAVGAGAGLAKSLWDKGQPASIPAGSKINIVIDQPITFSPQKLY